MLSFKFLTLYVAKQYVSYRVHNEGLAVSYDVRDYMPRGV